MTRVVIIDDEPLARAIVKEYLSDVKDFDVVAECGNGYEGIKSIQSMQPDLVFLDIQMPKITGFEMLELLEEIPPVIFTTAYDEYALKAFESSAVDYLLKPFTKERFLNAVMKYQNISDRSTPQPNIEKMLHSSSKQEDEGRRIVVRNNSEISIVPVEDIHYIEAFDDYVKIFTQKEFFLKKKTMNYYESVLDDSNFIRTHRSFIISLSQLTRVEPLEKNTWIAVLKSGKKIPLSRAGYLKLKDKLGI